MKKVYFVYDEKEKPIELHELEEFVKPEEVEEMKKVCAENKKAFLKRVATKEKEQEKIIESLKAEIESLKLKLAEQEQAILSIVGIDDDTTFEEYFGGSDDE